MNTTAEELYKEVFKADTNICLVFTTVFLTLEKTFSNKKNENKIYSKVETCFAEALTEATKGNQSKAEDLTKPFLKHKVFTWCKTKKEFIEAVSGIYDFLKEKQKADAYYISEGKIASLQVYID